MTSKIGDMIQFVASQYLKLPDDENYLPISSPIMAASHW